ncbi:oligosaccharide flippase family protein [Vreelandella titanicae]|uniref:Oligosaccharide flippase family protein n=1 Tax=Vreelandella titanicae TaxID=664683 RepID=A0A558J1Z5_9GAMM|nr:oligosaccharide flippase family protein [Halomonas titanicae]TVU87610.1 oligosaccharide flippase family protein [Halomonas titanicae]
MSLLKSEAIKAVSSLWLATLVGAGLAFFTQAILARLLLPEAYGVFSSSLSLVMLFVPLAGFGVAQFWLKTFGQEGWAARRWLKGSLNFIVYSTGLVFCGLITWALLGPHDLLTSYVLSLLAFHVLAQVILELVSSRLQLEEKYQALAIWQLFPHLFRFLLVAILGLFLSYDLDVVLGSLMYSLVALVMMPIGYYMLKPMFTNDFGLVGHDRNIKGGNDIQKSWKAVFALSWPFGLAAFAHLIYYQSDIVLLKYLDSDTSAGIYNIAFLVISAVYLLPGVIYQKYFLPKIHRWSIQEPARVKSVFEQGNIAMLLLGLLFMLGIWIAADWGITLLFGKSYTEAAYVLKALSFSVPFMFVAFSAGAVLVTQNHIKLKVKIMLLVALLNVVLNLILIPKYGMIGAASATILSNALLATLYFFTAKRLVIQK